MENKENISMRQLILLFITAIISPTLRYIPSYSARFAKQAAWLTPLFSGIILFITFYILSKLYKAYKNKSLPDIICDICGNILGKIMLIIIIIWSLILLALYIKYFADRLDSTMYPQSDMNVFIISMLFLVAYIMRNGIKILARMNEILLPLIVFMLFIFLIFLVPTVDVTRLLPITINDVVPIFQGSIGISAIWLYIILMLMFSDKIKNIEKIKKLGIKTTIIITFSTIIYLITIISNLGYKTVLNESLPTYMLIKKISFFKFIDRLDPLLISIWIITDFVLICTFLYSILSAFKKVFKLSDEKNYTNIFLLLSYFLTMFICSTIFELQKFGLKFGSYANMVIYFGFLLFVFIIGKIRKKI